MKYSTILGLILAILVHMSCAVHEAAAFDFNEWFDECVGDLCGAPPEGGNGGGGGVAPSSSTTI